MVYFSDRVKLDRQSRERNVIIFNAVESDAEDPQDRVHHDQGVFDELCRHLMIGNLKIDKVTRIGKKQDKQSSTEAVIEDGEIVSDESVKSRPMKVTFSSVFDKRRFFTTLWKLKDAPDNIKHLRIQHDLEKQEREVTKRLLKEAYNKNQAENPQNFLYRVRGPPYAQKIVKIYHRG